MDVEDNAAGEQGMNYTGQSTIPLMGYQLQVPWDDLQRNDQNEIRLGDIITGELEKSEAAICKR